MYIVLLTLGILEKASSVGAKTVKGPGPLRVSIKPAAVKAVASVLKEPASTAVSTISCCYEKKEREMRFEIESLRTYVMDDDEE